MKNHDPCPCDLGQPYGRCCGRWHGGEPAPDAASLMRARYSAWALGLRGYLNDTWHPSTRPAPLEMPDADVRWLGLEIRTQTRTGVDTAVVAFVARSKQAGRAHRLHETSRFVREAGRWLYVDGDIHPR